MISECMERLQAKTASFDWVRMLKSRLDLMNFKVESEGFEIIHEPLVEVSPFINDSVHDMDLDM